METRDDNWFDKAMGDGNENRKTDKEPQQQQQQQQPQQPPQLSQQPQPQQRESPQATFDVYQRKERSSNLMLKGLLIAGLTLLLLIPGLLVSALIEERAATQSAVAEELSAKWASDQLVQGPVLSIPYLDGGGKEKVLTILPERMDIKGELAPDSRTRSQIFKVVFYQTTINVEAVFKVALSDLGVGAQDLQLQRARLVFGVADLRGINGALQSSWDGAPETIGEVATTDRNHEQNAMPAGLNRSFGQHGGMSIPVKLTMDNLEQEHRFSLQLPLKGSGELSFTPVGKTTKVNISSPWTSPKFLGAFLPNESVVITDKGFEAAWEIVSYNRNYPQVWKDGDYNLKDSSFGMTLLQPLDSYAKTERSIKYALLFIALTFALYFSVEILQKRRVHPLQYVLVGLALLVFYTLLLSIGEYLGFDWAYLIAATATVSLIALYTMSAFGKASIGALFAAVLSVLYGFIYLLIQLSEGALLVGSIGLFALLAAIMYVTRGVDWYGDRASH